MSASFHRSRAAILIAFSACAALAGPARGLDRARLHGYYQDGEFERLLEALEAYGKGRCACSRADSLFAEKHLAVVLAANPATRELGRYHMHRLLDLAPRADLLDMYVGEEVDAVFEKVRKEHSILSAGGPAAARPQPAAASAREKPPAASRKSPAPARLPARPRGPAKRVVRPAAPSKTMAPAVAAASAPATSPASAAPARYSDAWAVLPAAHSAPKSAAGADSGPARRAGTAPAKASAPSPVNAEPPRPSWDRLPGDEAAMEAQLPADPDDAPTAAGIRDRARPAKAGARAMEEQDKGMQDAQAGLDRDSRRAWKEAGLWIGGGAALAAVAFTLWQAGSDDGQSGKTYDVPASVSP